MSNEETQSCFWETQFGLPAPMSMSQISKVLDLTLNAGEGLIPYLVSETSQGKTTLVKQWASDNGYVIHTYNMVSAEASDLQGIPFPSKDRKTFNYLTQGAIPINDDKRKVLLFLDEVNRAPNENKNIVFQILNRHLGENTLGVNVKMVLAGNPSGRYNVNNITDEPAFLRRCVILPCALNLYEALEYMKEHEWHPTVIEYVSSNTDQLQAEFGKVKTGHCFNTAAGWNSISDLLYRAEDSGVGDTAKGKTVDTAKTVDLANLSLNDDRILFSIISGIIGRVAAQAFWVFVTRPSEALTAKDLYEGIGVVGNDTGDKFAKIVEEKKGATVTNLLKALALYVLTGVTCSMEDSVKFHIRLFLVLTETHWRTYIEHLKHTLYISGNTITVNGSSFNTWLYNLESQIQEDPEVHKLSIRRLRVSMKLTLEEGKA